MSFNLAWKRLKKEGWTPYCLNLLSASWGSSLVVFFVVGIAFWQVAAARRQAVVRSHYCGEDSEKGHRLCDTMRSLRDSLVLVQALDLSLVATTPEKMQVIGQAWKRSLVNLEQLQQNLPGGLNDASYDELLVDIRPQVRQVFDSIERGYRVEAEAVEKLAKTCDQCHSSFENTWGHSDAIPKNFHFWSSIYRHCHSDARDARVCQEMYRLYVVLDWIGRQPLAGAKILRTVLPVLEQGIQELKQSDFEHSRAKVFEQLKELVSSAQFELDRDPYRAQAVSQQLRNQCTQCHRSFF